jgi:geranylgeranyl diphosphate synthase, type II
MDGISLMTQENKLDHFLKQAREEINVALDRFVPQPEDFGRQLFDAMRYSLFPGGKRLRPCLCLAVNESLGGVRRDALPAACALEMVHTYSLIHDDLPAMDDDDLRRGKPTCHRAFNEATAILAGDGLLTFAFQTVIDGPNVLDGAGAGLPPERAAEIVRILAFAAGPQGMVLGQIRDLESEKKRTDFESVRAIHETKTAAMIAASFETGAVAAGAGDGIRRAVAAAGRRIGLVFQIIDDILDVTATTSQLGKTAGKDVNDGKATYPAVIGLDRSRREAAVLTGEALDLLPGGIEFTLLRELAERMLARTR